MQDEKNQVVISPEAMVTVTQMNHLTEIQYMEKMNRAVAIKKLNKDEYVNLATGEIKEYQHIENRSESYNSLRQTFKKIRYLINNNFTGKPNELFVTLTYAENMTDTNRLYTDIKKFMMKLRYKYNDVSDIDYLSVIEPQGRGAWHIHMLLRFNALSSVFVPSHELAELWGHGFIKIERIQNVDNIGAYLSAYLADVELTSDNIHKAVREDMEIIEKEVDGEKKKFVKGGRLHMYPSGMNLYRKSKGITFPERKKMTYRNA
ncbi:TPA: hypothetical protein ACGO73_002058, partial [Streptococcus suis]